VRRPDSPNAVNSSNSEGMGYGMLIAVYMNDQRLFDALWSYVLLHLDKNGLMDWQIGADGTATGTGAATDGDEDMAFALVMADRQWGGGGSLGSSYLDYAKSLITAIFEHEVDRANGYVLLPGDSWAANPPLNPSYFAPAYYRVFGQVTGAVDDWNRVVESSYQVLERSQNEANQNATNGLVPAWCTADGVPEVPFDGAGTHFQLDACRVPFRIGQDYCYFGEPRAKAYLQKISAFYTGIGAANIVDGYDLNGTPHPQNSVNGSQAASFVGPAAVGAMSSADYQPLLNEAYARVATLQLNAGTTYYQESWTVLSLLMLTGNFSNLAPR
jgi:endo-1,4-beta-D-glucanase Y